MIEIIEEINKALSGQMWNSAIALALILPDICYKVENHLNASQNVTGRQYEDWFDNNVLPKMCESPIFENGFTGKTCWKLRCHMLHSGNADSLPSGGGCDEIEIIVPQSDESLPAQIYTSTYSDTGTKTTISVSLVHLCKSIASVATDFYDAWPSKTDFDNHTIRRQTHGMEVLEDINVLNNSI